MENTSGGGSNAVVPPEIDRWNWGAFLLTWIWGIGNNTLIALLMFVPFVNIVMWIVLGVKGSAWAWRNKHWYSVDDFKRTQRDWAKWGVIASVIAVLLCALFIGLFMVMVTIMKDSDAYRLAVVQLQGNAEVTRILGTPIATGIPMGRIETSGSDGKANLSFSAEGPKGKGTIYIEAVEAMGQWRVDQAVFVGADSKRRIDLHR
jgi:Cytochrome oxidase complex assembly protein 1